MKYIRTQNGRILEVLDEDKRYYYLDYPNEAGLALWGKFAKDVIKEANTIEELCDEFVVYDADIKRCHILDKGFYHRFDEECKKALYIANRYIYGAIWTDKGLIYVAKMNEKGELELL